MIEEPLSMLKARRAGFKAASTRAANAYATAKADHRQDQDPSRLEGHLERWRIALEKYEQAEDQVITHVDAVPGEDFDRDLVDRQNLFIDAKVILKGLRVDFDIVRAPPAPQQVAQAPPVQGAVGQGHHAAKVNAPKPPILEGDTDYKTFSKWREDALDPNRYIWN